MTPVPPLRVLPPKPPSGGEHVPTASVLDEQVKPKGQACWELQVASPQVPLLQLSPQGQGLVDEQLVPPAAWHVPDVQAKPLGHWLLLVQPLGKKQAGVAMHDAFTPDAVKLPLLSAKTKLLQNIAISIAERINTNFLIFPPDSRSALLSLPLLIWASVSLLSPVFP
jgi:hypothetical protein